MNNQTISSNMSEEEILRIENQYWVDMKAALTRLNENEDFKRIILEGYFKEKAVNGVSMLANSYVVQNNKRGEVMESLIAISHLQDYFITIESMSAPDPDEQEGFEGPGE